MKKIIGVNLLIDISSVEEKFLKTSYLLKLLKNLVGFLKLKPVGEPIVKKISTKGYPYSGYTFIQVIKESHIVINTWPEYNFLTIDIFTCKPPFDKKEEKKLISFIKSNLINAKIKKRVIKRYMIKPN